MAWLMPVNEILQDDISKLYHTLLPPGFRGCSRTLRSTQQYLAKIIDLLGEQSAAAQGLNRVITTADKMTKSPTHILYLLKDPKAKDGQGEVIGLLKVGRKHLFLFDPRNQVCEVEPMCVLDFFVLPDRQRHGCGKNLFDYMLADLGVRVEQLAIDGPSAKMEQFLSKNYGIERLIRHSNNFAIGPTFFAVPLDDSPSGNGSTAVSAAVGRFAAPRPPSAIATVIHGASNYYQDPSNGIGTDLMSPELETIDLSLVPLPEGEPPSTERPSSLRVEPTLMGPPPPPGGGPPGVVPPLSPAGSTMSRRDSQLTERGFFDVKFYHSKLW